jgi:hypothetical protein
MPIEHVPDTSLTYYLIAFDKDGRERTEADGSTLSQRLAGDLAAQQVTDVFLLSHGWKGDVPAAREQYNKWIATMMTCPADIARVRAMRPNFRPAIVGLHWPSLPFGDEEFGGGTASFDVAAMPTLEELIDRYADRIADTPAARAALKTIFESALEDNEPATLPQPVVDAYETLNREAAIGERGEGAAPGADREPFDAETAYQNARAGADDDPVSFGGGFKLSGLLSPLQQLSFWRMKDRGRAVGESGGHDLVKKLQNAAPNARVHLMGHSFGCIVVSASTSGPDGKGSLPRPIDTLFLVQGALSLWSYCSKIARANGISGYFRPIIAGAKVAGVMLATTSEFDSAVGRFYPLGAGVARQVAFAPGELPKYGGIGSFGVQGPDTNATMVDMLPVDQGYGFKAGRRYNLNANEYIKHGGGASGAHSDIAHPEVAHAYWEAIIARG